MTKILIPGEEFRFTAIQRAEGENFGIFNKRTPTDCAYVELTDLQMSKLFKAYMNHKGRMPQLQ